MKSDNYLLMAGGVLSVLASLLHIIIIFGGADWYRFFGAGKEMAVMAEQGSWFPHVVTFGIAIVLLIWGLVAFSGAGILRKLPFLKLALVIISMVYLLRGLVLFPVLLFKPEIVDGFTVWSSIISLIFGLCYASGTIKAWRSL